jgi:arylformamidase
MRIIDLSHEISPNMPVYPGTEPPVFSPGCSMEDAGFLEKKITFYSHTGTHMDAPAHLIKNSKTLDQFPIAHFYGKALLVNVENLKKPLIDIKDLNSYQDDLRQVEFVLIYTGWSRFWHTEKYFTDYPVLSFESAQWLSQFDLKGIGLDVISADIAGSRDFPIHNVFLKNNTVIIENLNNLGLINVDQFFFSCFPLNFKDADGSPVRAVAFTKT